MRKWVGADTEPTEGWPVRFILPGMGKIGERLRVRCFGLQPARALAEEIADDRAAVRALVRELFGDEIEVRKRAADVARRITERGAGRWSGMRMSWQGCWSRCRWRSRGLAGIWDW